MAAFFLDNKAIYSTIIENKTTLASSQNGPKYFRMHQWFYSQINLQSLYQRQRHATRVMYMLRGIKVEDHENRAESYKLKNNLLI